MMDEDIAKIEWWKDTSKKPTGFQLFQRAGNLAMRHQHIDPSKDNLDCFQHDRRCAIQPTTDYPPSPTPGDIRNVLPHLENHATSDPHGLHLPDHHAPADWIDYLHDYLHSRTPTADATQIMCLHMARVTEMEAALRDQIVTAINLFGGAVSHLRGFHHQDPPMKPCDVCGNEVTQRWQIRTNSKMPHDLSRTTTNHHALGLLQTQVCDRICANEPATAHRTRETDKLFVQKCLKRHLEGNVAAHACYKCALPAIREASCIAAEAASAGQYTRPTIREVDLRNYHAICRGDIRATNTTPETPRTRIVASDLDPWGRTKICGTVLIDSSGMVGIVVTRVPVPPRGTVRAYVRMVGAITTTKLRVPADIWDVDKCLAWSDEEVEQATVRLDIHTDGQRIRRLLWIPPDGVHTAGESSKATVTCTEFVNQKRRSLTLQQLTQQPESSTLSRKRAPHRSKDPAETPRNDPIVLKRSRPADPVQAAVQDPGTPRRAA